MFRIKTPAKFRKYYDVVLKNFPTVGEGGLKLESQVVYSRLKMLPKTKLPLDRTNVKIALSDLILGFKRSSYFLVFKLEDVDHEGRRLTFALKGLTTTSSWKLSSRMGPNCSAHKANALCYVQLNDDESRKSIKISRNQKSLIRLAIQENLEKLSQNPIATNIENILNNRLGDSIKKSIAEKEIESRLVKGVLLYEYMPKTQVANMRPSVAS